MARGSEETRTRITRGIASVSERASRRITKSPREDVFVTFSVSTSSESYEIVVHVRSSIHTVQEYKSR